MIKRTLLAAIFALAFASSAQAQIYGDVKVNATVPSLKTGASASTSVQGGADSKGEYDSGGSLKAGADAQTDISADIKVEDSMVITRGDISAADDALYDPADISTSVDLSAYARSIMRADANIVKIEAGANEVSIWYKEPAKFLGIIPVTLTTKATVSAEGEIEISRPWYRAFVTAEEESTLENSLDSTAGTIARTEGSATLSTNAQARLLNALRASMKMHYESTITTSTSTEEAAY
jgi:hypothetical protein